MGSKEISADKLDIVGLEFDDATHTYRLDGFEIPSVSAIMEPLSRSKYAHISEEILDMAASRGTAVHKMFLWNIKGISRLSKNGGSSTNPPLSHLKQEYATF